MDRYHGLPRDRQIDDAVPGADHRPQKGAPNRGRATALDPKQSVPARKSRRSPPIVAGNSIVDAPAATSGIFDAASP